VEDGMKKVDLRELVMALETDGCICLISKGRKRYYCPRIAFVGAEEEVVDFVKLLLEKAQVHVYNKIGQSANALGRRDLFHIWAEGNANLEPLLKMLEGKMISSKRNRQVKLLLEWIDLRRDWRHISYSPRCDVIIKEVSRLNKGESAKLG